MKLTKLIILFMICTVFSKSFSGVAASKTDHEYAIVISADASATEVYAAQVLQEYLAAIEGDEYPIISDDQPYEGFKYCIGETSVYDTSDIADKAADSYNIVPFNNGLAIYGSGNRGTIYGVSAFLEKCCGYRCYTAESGVKSATGKIILPEEKIEYNAFFEYRDTDWRSGATAAYSLVNKLNGDPHRALMPEQGGSIAYLGGFCHTLSTIFCSSDKYFESHPDYFALHEGKRVPGQLCLTNEIVYEIVLEEVLSLLRDSHDPKTDLQIISLSQADNGDYCECDACKALDDANGSHAGTMVTFVNRIARAVKEEGYDNVEFDTLAYMYTRRVPSDVRPEDNVIVRLCTFECCFSHPLDDTTCSENAEFMRDLEEWSAVCDKLYIWDYTTNYAYTLGIFPDFHVLQKNMQCFYEHGVRGVYEEGNYYIDKCDTEFGDLRSYLIAKLLEDPYCDYETEMLDFCNNYYGKGGEHIKTIIEEITAGIKDHVSIYSYMTESFSISEEEAEKIDQLWYMAENAAGSSDALAAIKRSKLSWRYLKAALGLREFGGTLEENKDEREALYNDLITHGVEMIDEWTAIEQNFSEYELIPVEEWEYAGRYYYLQYDLNGGTDGPPNQWCNIGASWIPDTIPTKEGYRFLGWATEKNAAAAEYSPGGFIYPSSDMSLYAVWEEGADSEASETQEGTAEPIGGCDLYIAGEKVDKQNSDMLQDLDSVIIRDGGYIRYDDSLRTLYLKDVDIIPLENQENDGTAINYNSQDDTALTIAVEGICHLESRDHGQDAPIVVGSWGNLNIDLQQGSVLEIEASPCREAFINVGIYIDRDDSDGILTVSGPGTFRVLGGDAQSNQGASIALCTQGDIIFEKDCSVNIISDTASAASIGCWLDGGNFILKDGSQVQVKGSGTGKSYGIELLNDRIYDFNTENWTGSMTVSGSSEAIHYERGDNAYIRKDPNQIRLAGYTNIGENNPTILGNETYKYNTLQKYAELIFEACK